MLLQYIVMRDNDKLIEGDDFYIDYDKFELVIKEAKADATYRLSVFLSNTIRRKWSIVQLLGDLFRFRRF